MNKHRLLKLADLLEADAKNRKGIKFDLNVVGMATYDDDNKTAKLDCGTSACAMGLAAISGAFKSAGLSYKITDGWFNNINCTINGRARMYDSAAKKIFGITSREADFLFTPSEYGDCPITGAAGERYVAKRIRDFVAGKVAPRSQRP